MVERGEGVQLGVGQVPVSHNLAHLGGQRCVVVVTILLTVSQT